MNFFVGSKMGTLGRGQKVYVAKGYVLLCPLLVSKTSGNFAQTRNRSKKGHAGSKSKAQ